MKRTVAAPSTANVGPLEKAREWRGYFEKRRRHHSENDVVEFLENLDEYRRAMREHSGRELAGAEVLEIGFGTRASRLALLSAAGASPIGVDPEVPLLAFTPSTLRRIAKQNGLERLGKSVARYLLFDRSARARLRQTLAKELSTDRLDYGRLEVGDAADLDLADDSLDLVVSEDVFEHMAVESVERTVAKMRRWLKPGAIALIRPNVYTGISGGHLAEWSVASVRDRPEEPRRSSPWEHLRAGRYPANTFLNELALRDYRRIFSEGGFEIVEERCRYPGLGAELLTPDARRDLSQWPDEELLSNQVLFVLRPR